MLNRPGQRSIRIIIRTVNTVIKNINKVFEMMPEIRVLF